MMKLIVFAVQQGLCAYVRTPNDYGILIDCGSGGPGETASPAEWLAENETQWLKRQGDAAVSLIVTHPHDNHLSDIDAVIGKLSPSALCCSTDFDWPAISDSNANVQAYHAWLSARASEALPDFGATVRCFSLSRNEAEELGGDSDTMINNRSVVTVVSYTSAKGYSWKVVIAGDNTTEGWEALLANPKFRAEIEEADFFVTSSHGEEVGFHGGLFKVMGKPMANISCSRVGGGRADVRYRKNAQGVKFPDGSRTHFITPEDGNITVEMRDDGRYDVWLFNP
jgi:beta-lactamase superfamily II metal-dependent hydrolase